MKILPWSWFVGFNFYLNGIFCKYKSLFEIREIGFLQHLFNRHVSKTLTGDIAKLSFFLLHAPNDQSDAVVDQLSYIHSSYLVVKPPPLCAPPFALKESIWRITIYQRFSFASVIRRSFHPQKEPVDEMVTEFSIVISHPMEITLF